MIRKQDQESRAIATSKTEIKVNEQLAEELHKLVTKKFKKRNLYAWFKHNIWAADLAEMESLSSKNKIVKELLFVIDVFAKYTWIKPFTLIWVGAVGFP